MSNGQAFKLFFGANQEHAQWMEWVRGGVQWCETHISGAKLKRGAISNTEHN